MSDIQLKVKQARAYGKTCVGCEKYDSDIMISFMNKTIEPIEFYDFFLDQVAAEKFHKELGDVLKRNKKSITESKLGDDIP